MTKNAKSSPKPLDAKRGVKISQTDFPSTTLEKASKVASEILENFAGKDAPPHEIAVALGVSPTSSAWRYVTGSSIAYGLTEGGYNASKITLTPLGRRLLEPLEEGDDRKARVESIMQARIAKEFFGKYNKAKFPKDDIAKNLLVALGLPRERASAALEILKENGKSAGIIIEGTSKNRPAGDLLAMLSGV